MFWLQERFSSEKKREGSRSGTPSRDTLHSHRCRQVLRSIASWLTRTPPRSAPSASSSAYPTSVRLAVHFSASFCALFLACLLLFALHREAAQELYTQ